MSQAFKKQRKATIALLVPAHNESLVIRETLLSAIKSGMKPEHIYVVDDNSSDDTSEIARQIIPSENVVKVLRSGKGLAIKKASAAFALGKRYRWVHIADADGRFAPNYFSVMRRELRVKNAAATGYIRSLPGSSVGKYRVFEYTVGMEIHRRIQSILGVIPIIPGPTSCFRGDVFEQLDFNSDTLTEDFDVTLQIYRKKLGKIQYIPKAVAYTQDPEKISQFIKQITRWNRGVLQVMGKHKVSRRFSPVDIYLNYQVLQNLLFLANFFIWIPYLTAYKFGPEAFAVAFLYDLLITFSLTAFAATRSNRFDSLAAFPIVYGLRWLNLMIFFKAYIEVVILRRHRASKGVWGSEANKRYKLSETH